MNAPVSVLIPCFNCSATLERAVDSVHAQTVRPTEILLVNDASTDNTAHIIGRLRRRYGDSWIGVIKLDKNCGPATARNVAWEKAKQPYVAFLDADDAWHPRKVEIQYLWMREHADVMLTGHPCLQIKEESSIPPLPEKWHTWQVTPRHLLISNRFPTRSVMLRRDVPYRFESGKRYCEDYLLWLKIVLGGLPAWRLELPMGYIYKRAFGESGLSERLWKMERGALDAYRHMWKQGALGVIAFWLAVSLSLLKYGRRLIIYSLSKFIQDISGKSQGT